MAKVPITAAVTEVLKAIESAVSQLPSGPEYYYHRSFRAFRERAVEAIETVAGALQEDAVGEKRKQAQTTAPLASTDTDADEVVEWLEGAQDDEFSRVDGALGSVRAALARKAAIEDGGHGGGGAVAGRCDSGVRGADALGVSGVLDRNATDSGGANRRGPAVPFHVRNSGRECNECPPSQISFIYHLTCAFIIGAMGNVSSKSICRSCLP